MRVGFARKFRSNGEAQPCISSADHHHRGRPSPARHLAAPFRPRSSPPRPPPAPLTLPGSPVSPSASNMGSVPWKRLELAALCAYAVVFYSTMIQRSLRLARGTNHPPSQCCPASHRIHSLLTRRLLRETLRPKSWINRRPSERV